ncbi:TIGR01777 family protein [Rubrobacter taiwanensis]|jgi:uncharacterized protein (TIGR01777 family)|uniref:TIGR01777 family protein n=1 Tax=Rubrobacter taiwanensis TaxID=185139 RepID=A0A4R1BPM8_9ACTN|nr:TIGR01777 family oxidoreductase [Rubrobacter taiwanensis]TCJ19448.1 TIGR01777 family protein [Rubrobacter taiwanensis]
MRVLVSGASGFLGSALRESLEADRHEVVKLTRRPPAAGERAIRWNPAAGSLNVSVLEGMDAVVHLAGENVAGRWTAAKKARIRESRVGGTRLLAESLARMQNPPGVMVCASAAGYYGDRGDEVLTEESPPGSGFLAEVAREWEAAADPARQKGIRVVHLRFGIVLSPEGGALRLMLLPFRMGLGGKLGSGRQYMAWISLPDAVGAVRHALDTGELEGPVNAVAPHPVRNEEFTRTLGRVLSRPTPFTLPEFAGKLVMGEMAEEMLFVSQRVEPVRLLETGYGFKHPRLEEALRDMLG